MANEVNRDTAEDTGIASYDGRADNTGTANGAAQTAKPAANSFVKEVLSWVETIVFAVLFAFVITTFVIVNAKVPSASMEQTVMTGDRLIANRLSYVLGEPQRYDIVVFKYPDDESKLYIKRIIGLPGETVEIRDGLVYIDGSDEPLRTDFQCEDMVTPDAVYNVPDGCYFMMGDNRNRSADSRFWKNKYVEKSKILGKAVFRYYPIGSIGFID